MAKKEKSAKVGVTSLRVKKQRPNVQKSLISKKEDIFIGKVTPKHDFPYKLKLILQKYMTTNNLDMYNTTHVHKKKTKNKKTNVNGFTAFRAYYSKFGKSYKEQESLSKELAIYWKNEPSIQKEWRGYSEEYKVADTNLSFVDWFDLNKSRCGPPVIPNNTYTQSTNISHLIVEDVYGIENL